MTKTTRGSGFYWVKVKDEFDGYWTVGHWQAPVSWKLFFESELSLDEHFLEIGERIEHKGKEDNLENFHKLEQEFGDTSKTPLTP